MDGYAVRCADVAQALHASGPAAGALPVSQRIAAGASGLTLAPMSVARIFTGAPIPLGADAVVMQEDCEVLPGAGGPGSQAVRIKSVPAPGQWIRRAGEDVTQGAVVLSKGELLTPASLGLAASIGMNVVLEEVATNVARHGGDPGQPRDLVIRLDHDDGQAVLVVEDDGQPFDPTTAPDRHIPISLADATPGGAGLTLIWH